VTSSSEEDIYIRDIAMLSPSSLLVGDYTNTTLRLVDSVSGVVLSKATLPSHPRRLCLLSDGRVAVTLYNSKKIQFICVANDTLLLDRSIDVKNIIAGIAQCDSSYLAVSCDSPSKVEIMTMDGRVINDMDNKKAGKHVFQYPYFIAPTTSGDIFVSDHGTSTITQMDRTLRISRTFSSPTLTSPYSIVSVSTDQLLVADRDSHSIVVLNPTNGTVTHLVGKTDGIQEPLAVAWCTTKKRLYVSSYGCQTTLRVFHQK